METVLLRILNMSIGAGWLILAAVLFRLVFWNAPKRFRCIVWALVAVRLVCPLTIRSPLSLVPSAAEVPADILTEVNSEPDSPYETGLVPEQGHSRSDSSIIEALSGMNSFAAVNNTGNALSAEPPENVNAGQLSIDGAPGDQATHPGETGAAKDRGAITTAGIITAVWLGGAALMLAYAAYSYISLYKKTRIHETLDGSVIRCDEVGTPFIFGVFRPRIVIPTGISEYDAYFAVAHEKAHLERRDHLIKPFAFLLLAIHWFNPLMWLGYILLCRDIELACDEKVIRSGGIELKKSYSRALINCSIPASAVSACPVAFGEIGVKARVRSVLSYSKPKWTTVTAAVLCCAAIAVFFLTSPVKGLNEELPAKSNAALAEDETNYDRFYILHERGTDPNAEENTLLSISSLQHRYRMDHPNGEVSFGTFTYKTGGVTELTDDKSGRTLTVRKQGNDLVFDGEAQTVFEAGSVFDLIAICSQQEYLLIYDGSGFAYYPDTATLLVYGDFETAYSLLNGRLPKLPSEKSADLRDTINAALECGDSATLLKGTLKSQLSPLGEFFGECTASVVIGQENDTIHIYLSNGSCDDQIDPYASNAANGPTPGSKFVNGSRRYPWW